MNEAYIRQDDLRDKPLISVHNEPQVSPQEYDCGCVSVSYVTDRDIFRREYPFEMRLVTFCNKKRDCQVLGHFWAHDIRDLAVALVDWRHGYTCEFSHSYDAHIQEYDECEAALRAMVKRNRPVSVLCS